MSFNLLISCFHESEEIDDGMEEEEMIDDGDDADLMLKVSADIVFKM